MRKERVVIRLRNYLTQKYRTLEVDGLTFSDCVGLAITPTMAGSVDTHLRTVGWTLTHTQSGWALVNGLESRTVARKLMRLLPPLDYTQRASILMAQGNMARLREWKNLPEVAEATANIEDAW